MQWLFIIRSYSSAMEAHLFRAATTRAPGPVTRAILHCHVGPARLSIGGDRLSRRVSVWSERRGPARPIRLYMQLGFTESPL